MLTMREFWKYAQPYVEQRAVQWGFRAHSRGIFVRERDQFWNGFAVVTSRNQPHSCYVLIGIHIPALHGRELFVDGYDYPRFEISHRLGTFREGLQLRGLDVWYGFRNESQLQEAMDRMFGNFEAWALPWYEQFHGLADVAAEFHRWRIAPGFVPNPPGADPAQPDVFGWAMYGWMLDELGRRDEAQPWWERAYAEVTRPLFIDKIGRFVREGTKGSKPFRHPEAEERLEELLRQSLGLPIA